VTHATRDIDTKTSGGKKKVDWMKRERHHDIVDESSSSSSSSSSPEIPLPLELWALIFSFTVGGFYTLQEIPLLFTEICKLWRDEASRLFAPALLAWIDLHGSNMNDDEIESYAHSMLYHGRRAPRPYACALFRKSRREISTLPKAPALSKTPSLHFYRCTNRLYVIRAIHERCGYADHPVGQPHSRTADMLYLLEVSDDKSRLLPLAAYKSLITVASPGIAADPVCCEPTATTRIGDMRYDITSSYVRNEINYRSYLQYMPGANVHYNYLKQCEWRHAPPITYEAGYVVPAVWPTDGTHLDRTAVVSRLPIDQILWYLNHRALLYHMHVQAYDDIVKECGGV